ncbi:hypothetical protein [uncultured Methanobrevibacter sp.]|uniref:hypothetical protein n=1 Tax=uncultured Methanobrevibacter sp. TaxID=253161 RepID=UPI0025DE6766|nr:hypothetical protein [uncultured Methanobrevibacter sp.]
MKEKDFDIKTKVIKETFDDNSHIVSSIDSNELEIDSNIHQGGDIFITSTGEFIDLEFQDVDFTAEELAKYMEFAEELYEKYGKRISIYILCPKNINVNVKEFEIYSNAPFTIKLACINEDPCEIILTHIKEKMKKETLDANDIMMLARLPGMCQKEDRKYYLTEYIRIVSRL